jgi:serine/threonine protein kinase
MSTKIISQVGAGGYGKVYKIIDIDGSEKALKRINWAKLNILETDILLNLNSPHVIRAYRVEKDGFIMDLMSGDMIDKTKTITPKEILSCFFQILDGLYCLHKMGILHLDIKPENYLFKYDHKGKLICMITDFGISKRTIDAFSPQKLKDPRSTEGYDAPELPTHIIDSRVDVFSFCVSLHTMMFGSPRIRVKYYDTFEKKKKYFYEKIIDFNSFFKPKDKITYEDTDNLARLMAWMYAPVDLRPNTRDLYTDSYISKRYVEDECTHKHSKVYYVPFINHFTFEAIKKIEKRCMEKDIKYFFLSVEIFFMIESIDHTLYSEKEENRLVRMSYELAVAYLEDRRIDLPKGDIIFSAINLSGSIRESRFLKESKYLEDLILLKKYLLESETLLNVYNLLEPEYLFSIFREKYGYDSKNSAKIPNFLTLKKMNSNKLNNLKYFDIIDPQLSLEKGYIKQVNESVKGYRNKNFDNIIDSFSYLEREIKEMEEYVFKGETENNFELQKLDSKSLFEFYVKSLNLKVNVKDYLSKKDLKKGCNFSKKENILFVIAKKKNYVFYSSSDITLLRNFIPYKLDKYKMERFVIICYMYHIYNDFSEIMLEHNDYIISLLDSIYEKNNFLKK